MTPHPDKPPRVFVSYSHESPEHSQAVLAFVQRLRAAGVDAWLDVFEVAPPEGWPRWLLRQLRDADRVVFVCTATYRRRFDGEEVPGVGLGVSWEGLLATQILIDAGSRNGGGRFVPVTFAEHGAEDVPLQLRPFGVWQVPRDEALLLRRLFGLPPEEAAPLGPLAVVTPTSTGVRGEATGTGVPRGLVEAYRGGDLVVFVGADLPLAAGLPAGEALPAAVLREAIAHGIEARVAEEVAAALADRAPAEALGLLAHELGRPTINKIVAGLLDDSRAPVPALARAIAALAPGLRAIWTTNLDRLLERSLPPGWRSAPRLEAGQGSRCVVHLHGVLGEEPAGWVLTEDDLRRVFHRDPVAAARVQATFAERCVLLVGFNFEDADLAAWVDRLASISEGRGRQHFALVDAANARSLRPQRRRELAQAGIEVVPCGHAGGAFGGVLELLGRLAEA